MNKGKAKMPHTVTFDMDSAKGWCVGGEPADTHRLDIRGDGPQEVVIDLGEATHKGGYQFDQKDPIWTSADLKQCPKQPALDDQLEVQDCSATQLTLRHKNKVPTVLRYQLNVFRDGKSKPIDPIMSNGPHSS